MRCTPGDRPSRVGAASTSESHDELSACVPRGPRRVVPIFVQERPDLGVDLAAEPDPSVGDGLVRCHIAMADTELRAQGRRGRDRRVERVDSRVDEIDHLSADPTCHAPRPPFSSEAWFEILEGEAPPECHVHERQGPIGDVHGADDVEVIWHEDAFAVRSAVGEFDGLFPPPLAGLEEGQKLPEYLGGVAAVNFLDHEHKLPIRLAVSGLDRLHEDTVDKVEPLFAFRPPATHKIFVGERGMKLDDA